MTNTGKLIVGKFLGCLVFAVPFQALFLEAKGLSFEQIMLLESILLVGILLFEIPTGILGDKIGRKWSLVSGATIGLIAWIPWFSARGFAWFAFSFFLSGIAIAFQSGSDQALLYDDLKTRHQESQMKRVAGAYFGSMTLATALAAIVGGFLAVHQSLPEFTLLYILTVIAQAIGLVVFLTIREPRLFPEGNTVAHAPENSLRLFVEGLHLLRKHRELKRLLLLSIFTMPFSYVLVYIFQPYFRAAHVPTIWFGIAVAVSSLLAAATKFHVHRLETWFGERGALLLVSLAPAACWTAMACIFHPALAVLFFILNDNVSNARDPLYADYFNRHIGSKNRATVLSTISMTGSLYAVIARPVIGYLADVDIRLSFLTMALLIVFGTLLFGLRSTSLPTE